MPSFRMARWQACSACSNQPTQPSLKKWTSPAQWIRSAAVFLLLHAPISVTTSSNMALRIRIRWLRSVPWRPCCLALTKVARVQSLVDVGLMEPVNQVVVRARQVQLLPAPRALSTLPSQPTVLQALYGTRKKLTATQWHVYGVEHMLTRALVLNHPGMGATLQTFYRRPEGRDARVRSAADTLTDLTTAAEGPSAWRVGQLTPLGPQDASPFRIGDVDPGVPLLTIENGSSIAVAAPHDAGRNYLLIRRPSGQMQMRKFTGCFLVRLSRRQHGSGGDKQRSAALWSAACGCPARLAAAQACACCAVAHDSAASRWSAVCRSGSSSRRSRSCSRRHRRAARSKTAASSPGCTGPCAANRTNSRAKTLARSGRASA